MIQMKIIFLMLKVTKIIKDRLIVSSGNVADDYGAVDKVIGLGYTILQYETDELAKNAKEYV